MPRSLFIWAVVTSLTVIPAEGLTQVVGGAQKAMPTMPDDASISDIRTGETALGVLERSDNTLEDGSLFDLWLYRGRAGRTVAINLLSNDFDAYLGLVDAETFDFIQEDDDSGGGTNAQLHFTPSESKPYGILVNSYDSGESGQYALSVTLDGSAGAATLDDLAQPNWERLYPGGGNPDDRYALIVGISDYPGSGEDLIGPTVDASQFRGLLIDKFGFQSRNIITLTDSDATRDHILQAFSRHLGQAGPDGVAVFFYSGHGLQMEENLFLSGANDLETDGMDEAIVVWGPTENSLILDDEIGLFADQLRANRTLIVLDACYSGTGTRSDASDGRQPKWVQMSEIEQSLELPEAFLARGQSEVANSSGSSAIEISGPSGHILLAASADDEVAYTDPDFGYGVFTRMLVEEMRDAPVNATFAGMMTRVRQRTLERTQGAQTPQVEGRLSSRRISQFLARNR